MTRVTLAPPKTDAGASTRTGADLAAVIRNVLRWDVDIPDEKIEVLVRNGHVTLSGTVDYWYKRGAAAHAIRRLSGVVSVRDRITIEPHGRADAEIAADIGEAIARRSSASIRVDVRDGVVTLRGLVLTHADRLEAEKAAWSAHGVRDVENTILTTR